MHSLIPLEFREGTSASQDEELLRRDRLLSRIQRFRERVDREIPGLYHWFRDSSLHVTLRGLIN